jgi:hypothetical protein
MRFLEKDLEQIIYEQHTSGSDFLYERGLNFQGKCFRQKKIGNYGIADLIFAEKPYFHTHWKRHQKGIINVVELKKDKISVSSFFQAVGYLKGVQRYLKKRGVFYDYNYVITIIGSEIDTSSTISFLPDFFIYHEESDKDEYPKFCVQMFTYKYEIDGISFHEVGNYSLTNEGL